MLLYSTSTRFATTVLLACFLLFPLVLRAQISIGPALSPYTQNFNSLPASGISTWENNLTIPGWHVSTGASSLLITASDGSHSSAGLYSFGSGTGSTDRALGGITTSNSGDILYGIHFTNDSGNPIGHFSVTFNMEQWRRSSGNGESLFFEVSKGTSLSLTNGTWTPVSELETVTTSNNGKVGPRNGNMDKATKTFTILNINLAVGQEIMFRWRDDRTASYGMAIDDVEITPHAQKVFYSKNASNLHELANWGTNGDGTGEQPVSFEISQQIFSIRNYPNGASILLAENWTVSGENSKVILGNSQSAITLTIPSNKSLRGLIDVADHATLIIDNLKLPKLGKLAANSTIIYGKEVPFEIEGGTYGNLTLKADKVLNLLENVRVQGKLDITGSQILLNDYDLTLSLQSNLIGANASSYIVTNGTGSLKMPVQGTGGEVVFPVGNSKYNPVSISLSIHSQEDYFLVRVIDGVYSSYNNNQPNLLGPIASRAVNRTWVIDEEVKGGSDITLSLSWHLTDVLAGFDPLNSHIKHFENNAWDKTNNTFASLTGSEFTLSRSGIKSFSPFGVFSEDPQPLPVSLLYFQASASEGPVNLGWATASEQNNSFFAVERSTDGTSFTEVARIKGAGTTSTQTTYTASDKAPLSGTSYYRLRQVDLNGKAAFSAMQAVTVNSKRPVSLSLYPNPAQGAEVSLKVTGLGASEAFTVTVRDLTGRWVLSKSINSQQERLLIPGELPAGAYMVTLSAPTATLSQRLLIK